MKPIFFILLVFASFIAFSQNQILVDSLTVKYENTTEDTVKMSALEELYKLYFRTDNYVALNYAEKILVLAKRANNDMYKSTGLYYKMLSYMYIGNYEKCLELNMERLELNKRKNYIASIFGTYHDIGVTYDRLRQFDLALEFYFKALNTYYENYEANSKEFSLFKIQSLYNNIGNIYSSNGDLEKAEQYYKKGISICIQKKDFLNLGTGYNNLGKVYMEKNDDKALWYLTRALQIRDSINDENGLGTSHTFMAQYYFLKDNYNTAISHARKAFGIGKKIQSLSIESESASALANAYNGQQKYDSAFFYYKIHKNLNDSIINNETYSKIEGMKLQNEFEIQTQKQKLESQKVKFRFVTFILLLVLALIVLFLLIRYFRERKERISSENKDLKMEVELKNKELTSIAMQQMRTNNLVDSIKERLLLLKKKVTPDQKEQIQKIIMELHALSDKEVWDEFELRFQQVHEVFYNNLKSKFPQLSPSEIKLAAFLRLNMTSKDISSLTGLSVKSIESSRYRLRKKLGIAKKEINLVNFLMEI
ncbi:Tetratricopeptide repeat-containing protein [Mariniphaga anaerophila]|uniref:Tetratricopeptide repeat-containing protein n=1 Tax=Mariniphaga anaerophila TaxID=1484053 RepID=A0A1M4SWY1_9BACT|nr:tetratricopeptide repeat protein [Mariniphaga anaerophila]SHE36733.1 Tetratricopeptide repeat-containing protein [Mariniphaga anaerophila]